MKQSTTLWAAALLPTIHALNDGFGQKPPMGYNTYNDVACTVNDTFVRGRINDMANAGMLKVGYSIFQIDCGWQGYNRLSNGSITYDSAVFPNGIKPLSSLAISKGFQWGMYTDEGVYACDTSAQHRPGSLNHEKDDALMFAAWNAAYVKVDNCWVTANSNAPKDPQTDFVSRYSAMSNALQGVGIKGMLVCQWGVPYSTSSGLQGPAQWTPQLATSFRVSDDISSAWTSVMRIMNEAIQVNLNGQSGPGQWADMDLLEVGNPGMTVSEQATHFSLWAIFKSPLWASTDLSAMSGSTKNILLNQDIVDINQDSKGKPATLVQRFTNDYDVYTGPLANGDMVVMLFDQTNTARTLSIDFSTIGIKSATAKDLWSKQVTTGATAYSKNINPHDQLLLRLSNIVYTNAQAPNRNLYAASTGTLSGNANTQNCSGCANGKKVGYLDSSSTVTISNIQTSQKTQDVFFNYINCEIGYINPCCGTNVRLGEISVNGGAAVEVSFPLTGYNWDTDLINNYRVRLSGFNPGQANTITIRGPSSGYAPDFSSLSVVA